MEKCVDYVKGGPSYNDQMYDCYMETFNNQNICLKDFEYIWDSAMRASEKAHNERIRNIVSPLVNLITMVDDIIGTEGGHSCRDKKIEIIKEIGLTKHCNEAVERLLNIPKQ